MINQTHRSAQKVPQEGETVIMSGRGKKVLRGGENLPLENGKNDPIEGHQASRYL